MDQFRASDLGQRLKKRFLFQRESSAGKSKLSEAKSFIDKAKAGNVAESLIDKESIPELPSEVTSRKGAAHGDTQAKDSVVQALVAASDAAASAKPHDVENEAPKEPAAKAAKKGGGAKSRKDNVSKTKNPKDRKQIPALKIPGLAGKGKARASAAP